VNLSFWLDPAALKQTYQCTTRILPLSLSLGIHGKALMNDNMKTDCRDVRGNLMLLAYSRTDFEYVFA